MMKALGLFESSMAVDQSTGRYIYIERERERGRRGRRRKKLPDNLKERKILILGIVI